MAFLYSCTLSGMGSWRYGSVRRMRPGGDDRMRCTRSNGRFVEIGGVDGNVDACGLEGGGNRMRRTRSGGRVVIRFG